MLIWRSNGGKRTAAENIVHADESRSESNSRFFEKSDIIILSL